MAWEHPMYMVFFQAVHIHSVASKGPSDWVVSSNEYSIGKNKAYYNSQQILAIEFIVVMQHLVQFNCQVVGFMQISFVPTTTTIAMVNKTMSQPIASSISTVWAKIHKNVQFRAGCIYKNRVKNDRKDFEIPALLSSKWGNLERENLKKYYEFWIFPLFTALDFLVFGR